MEFILEAYNFEVSNVVPCNDVTIEHPDCCSYDGNICSIDY